MSHTVHTSDRRPPVGWVLSGLMVLAALGAASAAEPDNLQTPYRRPVWIAQAGNPDGARPASRRPIAVAQTSTTRPPDQPPQPDVGQPNIPRVPGEQIPPSSKQPHQPPGRPRLPYLGQPRLFGEAPVPDAKTLEKYKEFIGEIVDPDNTLKLVVGRPRLLILKEIPKRVQIADEGVAIYGIITEKEISVLGRQTGTTVMNMWFTDPKDPTKQKILSYLLEVIPDPAVKSRLEAIYKALEEEINRAFPDSWVCLGLVGDKLVVSGQAKDIAEATQILRILRANAPEDPNLERARIPLSSVNVNVLAEDLESGLLAPTVSNYLLAGGPNVINLLRIPGEQQVNLRVTVAEINRAAARSIGMNFSIMNNNGITVFAQNTGNLVTEITDVVTGQNIANLPVALDQGQVTLAINALKQLNFARTLAEPNLVTLSGHPAAFQAGGQFPVPVVTGFTAAGLQGVTFVPFGVQLTFTPYVTDRDRIRLEVSAEVSTRDLQSGTVNIGGTAVPNLTTRNFQTTVEMREGQTFAVAGLIQNNFGARTDRVPLLGDLPVLGHMWGFTQSSAGEQELVILVTPELVHPMEPDQVTPLPGSDVFEAGDYEFYVFNRLESRRSYDYRSPVMTDIHRMFRYRHCDQIFIMGPSGHSDMPAHK
jgi:pilus assembly protein CpaC